MSASNKPFSKESLLWMQVVGSIKRKGGLVRLLFCLALLFTSTASADLKIAVFDMQAAIKQTKDGQLAHKTLTEEFKRMQNRIKKGEYDLSQKVKAFEKKALLLSDKKRQEQQSEIQQLSFNIQKEMQKLQVDFQKKQIVETQPIVEKLQQKITQLSQQKGYDLILNKSSGQVLWTKETLDITQEVVRMYESS
jgi:outer membrane protein